MHDIIHSRLVFCWIAAAALIGVSAVSARAQTIGPDIIVNELAGANDIIWWGEVGGVTAYSFRTESCNIGDMEANWFSGTEDHPVISQSMFRLSHNRFEQIGQSWVKHGFATENGVQCGPCEATAGETLGVGCSDPYSAALNGAQGLLGPRSQVNAATGGFVFPFSAPFPPAVTGRRLLVHNDDLSPALHPNARYFIQGQYVSADDAIWGNAKNNAAWRQITVGPNPINVSPVGPTHSLATVIEAWKTFDPAVHVSEIEILNDGDTGFTGWMYIGASAAYLGDCRWQYCYAVLNHNSHQSCGSFSVALPPGVIPSDIGFRDVDYHSGDNVSGLDWTAAVDLSGITWSTEPMADNAFANALRWGTMYTFWFETNVAPVCDGEVSITLWRSPAAGSFAVTTLAPGTEVLCSETGDVDRDCDVDADDYAAFLAAYGSHRRSDNYQHTADMDAKGMIGRRDYLLWLARYRDFIDDPTAGPPLPQWPRGVILSGKTAQPGMPPP